jgi:hypothetical protein
MLLPSWPFIACCTVVDLCGLPARPGLLLCCMVCVGCCMVCVGCPVASAGSRKKVAPAFRAKGVAAERAPRGHSSAMVSDSDEEDEEDEDEDDDEDSEDSDDPGPRGKGVWRGGVRVHVVLGWAGLQSPLASEHREDECR